jgi:hypothetical protein
LIGILGVKDKQTLKMLLPNPLNRSPVNQRTYRAFNDS